MIRLHRLAHVCLRVADLDEASARWQIQFGLVERADGTPTDGTCSSFGSFALVPLTGDVRAAVQNRRQA